MKFNILKDVGGEDLFGKMLRVIILEKKLKQKQLAIMIGKCEQQIQRYESLDDSPNKQMPPLNVFKDLCIALQVSPERLLGLEFVVSDKPLKSGIGIIYEWKLVKDKLYWTCPECNRKNIIYNDFSKNKKILKEQEFLCEYDDCGKFFNKLSEIKNG
jgi:transcriptional regulator with XRE-family HTH domain